MQKIVKLGFWEPELVEASEVPGAWLITIELLLSSSESSVSKSIGPDGTKGQQPLFRRDSLISSNSIEVRRRGFSGLQNTQKIQLLIINLIPLVNKPFVSEVTLREQNLLISVANVSINHLKKGLKILVSPHKWKDQQYKQC